MSTAKPFKAWCVFVAGRPDWEFIDGDLRNNDKHFRIFSSRRSARLHSQDVRRVEIREIKPKGKRE